MNGWKDYASVCKKKRGRAGLAFFYGISEVSFVN